MSVKVTKSFCKWQSAQAETQNSNWLKKQLIRIYKRKGQLTPLKKTCKVKYNCQFLKLTGYETYKTCSKNLGISLSCLHSSKAKRICTHKAMWDQILILSNRPFKILGTLLSLTLNFLQCATIILRLSLPNLVNNCTI